MSQKDKSFLKNIALGRLKLNIILSDIRFDLRKLKGAEPRYTITERENLAVLLGYGSLDTFFTGSVLK
jgi:hypothetical protein